VTQAAAASSRRFAAELADRLNEVVPAGFAVTADDVSVELRRDGQFVASTDMAELVQDSENLDDLPANLETAARAIMSNIQDWIADATSDPWPGIRSQPNPSASVQDHQLHMWFGDADGQVLSLRPLDLD
jgi:hypothetical protein